jgi:AraC family transcriptional regulator
MAWTEWRASIVASARPSSGVAVIRLLPGTSGSGGSWVMAVLLAGVEDGSLRRDLDPCMLRACSGLFRPCAIEGVRPGGVRRENEAMDLYGHGRDKYGAGDVLQSAVSCRWSGIAAELRHHPAGELAPFDLVQTEIGMAVAAHPRAVVSRCGNGVRQTTRPVPGTLWTCPAGVREEEIRLVEWHDCFHIYLPAARFADLSEAKGGATVAPGDIPYLADFADPFIRQCALTLLEAIREPSSAARVLAETIALSLTARLAQACTPGTGLQARALGARHALDDSRLERVIAFVEAHIEDDIGLDDLAGAACLSPFHFTRMFGRRTGLSPGRYLARRRLQRAESMLAATDMKIGEIALACGFSSQANFTRAFRRSTGTTPAAFRRSRR